MIDIQYCKKCGEPFDCAKCPHCLRGTITRHDKKKILDNLYYNVGKQQFDFMVCGLIKRDGEIISTKWKKFSDAVFPIDFDGTSNNYKEQSYFDRINQRQIFPNEVVIDLEEKESIKDIVKVLDEKKETYYIFKTGSRGYHIHIFYDEVLEEEIKLRIIKKFGGDEQLANLKHMISLEWVPHWKSGKIKEEVNVDGL